MLSAPKKCENDKVHSKRAVTVSYLREVFITWGYSLQNIMSDTKFQKLDFKRKRKNMKLRGRSARGLNTWQATTSCPYSVHLTGLTDEESQA